jgi:outer membrane biosynthesis protein TonB
MYLSFLYSILLHIFLTIFVMFGVNYSHNRQLQEETILLELMPIDIITNIKTTTSSNNLDKNKPLESTEKIEQSTVRKNKSDNKTEGMSAIKERLKDKISEDKKLADKQNTQVKNQDIESEKLPTPKKIQPKKEKEPVKEVKKSSEKTTTSDKKKTQPKSDLDEELANTVLKSLEEGGTEKVKKKQNLNDLMENAIKGDTTEDYNPEGDLSMSEVALIRSQISKAWRVGAFSGGKDNKQLKVVIKIILEPNGEIRDIKVDKKRSEVVSSRLYDAFVDSVLRAVRLASPLKNLPPDKFDTWEEMELMFDSSGMIY